MKEPVLIAIAGAAAIGAFFLISRKTGADCVP